MKHNSSYQTEYAISKEGPIAGKEQARPSVWALLGSTAALYMSFGLIYGLMQGGLPPLMRARGIDLAAIGWTFLMLVPFGLTFLWAPVVDAFRPIRSAPRIGWIVPMQGVIVGTLLIVAQGEAFPPAVLLGLGILVAFAAATMDVALDALSTASVPGEHRTTAGGLKVAALALGGILGGGVFVATAGKLGWTATFQICAAVSALAMLPILLNRGWDRPDERPRSRRPDVLAIIRQPIMRRRMGLLTLATCSMVALAFFNRVMLVDIGVPVETIGWIVGTGAPVCGLVASLLTIPLLRRFGTWAGVLLFTTICAGSAATMVVGLIAVDSTPALVGAIAMNAGTNGFFVILSATTLGWAKGNQPATDYAVLYGASRLVATAILIALANIVQRIGWPTFYVAAAFALIITAMLLRKALPDLRGRREESR